MIANLLAHGGIADLFEHAISTDRAKTFGPDPRAYELGVHATGETLLDLARWVEAW